MVGIAVVSFSSPKVDDDDDGAGSVTSFVVVAAVEVVGGGGSAVAVLLLLLLAVGRSVVVRVEGLCRGNSSGQSYSVLILVWSMVLSRYLQHLS